MRSQACSSSSRFQFPDRVAVAIQDHGYRPGAGNNEMRFEYLQSLLDGGGDLFNMVFVAAPDGMTRMAAVLESLDRRYCHGHRRRSRFGVPR